MNIFKQFAVSLYSPKLMAMFRFQKIGKTIGYIFVMMLIAYIFIGINIALLISNGVNQFDQAVNEGLPDFQLANGELTSPIEEPIIRENSLQTFIFDTTGAVTRDDLEQYGETVAFLDDRVIIKSGGTVDELKYSMFKDLNLTKSDVMGFLDKLKAFLPFIIAFAIILAYIFATALKFIGVSVLALIGLVIKSITKRNLSYRQLWILSAYAATLPTIFFAIMDALTIVVTGQFWIYWFVATVMLTLVVQKVPLPKKKVTE
ncbi:DUF1189 domain-containing protein [Pseudalkalibacillus decolorationis]|uniref:DUF1189 domain-containing protein n=1 Tax=Pseudalkalibacillus decolorationis TaxID=163879 RepID=UPI0021481045|nr:DUF1189 domain-containing protein [Pseudalkalibacillus decolorationis]